MNQPASFKVAAAQLEIGYDQKSNLDKCLSAIRRASENGARLVLLPEFSNIEPMSDKSFDNPSELNALYDSLLETTYFTKAIGEAAKNHKIHVAINILSKGSKRAEMFDESFLFSLEGKIVGSYQKTVLIGFENDFCVKGRHGIPVFETDLGRIGMYVCMDGVIPETTRVLALSGAQILLNSLHSTAIEEAEFLVPSRAVENGVWVISSNRVGGVKIPPGDLKIPSGDLQFSGGSSIVSPDGRVLAKGSIEKEEIIYGEVTAKQADNKIRESCMLDLFSDRRPELYSSLASANPFFQNSLENSEPLGKAKGTSITISVVQNECSNDTEISLDRALAQCAKVAKMGAKIIVFPELFLFEQRQVEADPSTAAKISQTALEKFSALSSEAGIFVALSLVEESKDSYYSTLYLIGDQGRVVEKYRKAHLSGFDRKWASRGNSLVVARTKYGNLGLMLGSEVILPEIARTLTLMGADCILYPCNWANNYEQDWLVKARTTENHICIAAANRIDSRADRGSIITPVVSPFASFTENKSIAEIFDCVMPRALVGELTSSIDFLLARNKEVIYKTNLVLVRRVELYKPIVAR